MTLMFNAVYILLYTFVTFTNVKSESLVYKVYAEDSRECCSRIEKKYEFPPIYCYSGNEKSVLNVFQTITVDLIFDKSDDYIVYQASDHNEIEKQMISDEAVLSWNKLISYFWKQKDFKLNPFEPSCFSIKTDSNFKIKIHSNVFDSRRLAMFIFGLILFGYSAQLSHNSFFYYLCGMTIGVTASLVVIAIFLSRLIPQKKLMFGYLGASFMFSLYAVQMFIENLNMILILYYKFILGYIMFSMLVSFVVCYRYGPVTNPRSIDLIKWTLQLIGLGLITLCSYHLEAMVFVDILSIIFYYTKFSLPFRLLPKKKPTVQLLTEEEYVQQALIETPKALEDLRKYCSSPNCDSWKFVKKLRDPKKFAEFVNSGAHITARSVEEYEKDIDQCETEVSESDSDPFDDFKEIEYTTSDSD